MRGGWGQSLKREEKRKTKATQLSLSLPVDEKWTSSCFRSTICPDVFSRFYYYYYYSEYMFLLY